MSEQKKRLVPLFSVTPKLLTRRVQPYTVVPSLTVTREDPTTFYAWMKTWVAMYASGSVPVPEAWSSLVKGTKRVVSRPSA